MLGMLLCDYDPCFPLLRFVTFLFVFLFVQVQTGDPVTCNHARSYNGFNVDMNICSEQVLILFQNTFNLFLAPYLSNWHFNYHIIFKNLNLKYSVDLL